MSILIFSLFALAVSVWSLVRALKTWRELDAQLDAMEKELNELAARWDLLKQQARERDKR